MNIKRFNFFLLLQLFSIAAIAQCFIPNSTIKYCEGELNIDLTSSEVQLNGTYKYFFNGAQIFIPEFWFPIPFGIVDGEYTEFGTGCVATFKLTIEPILIAQPDLEEEYFLSCFEPQVTLDPNINTVSHLNYFWYLDGNLIANSEVIHAETGGIYTLQAEEINSGCSVTAEVLVHDITFDYYTAAIVHNCDTTATFIIDIENDNANIIVEWDGVGVVDDSDPYEFTVDTIGIFSGLITNIETGCMTPFQFFIDSLGCTISAINTTVSAANFTIFPNPFSQFLNVRTTKEIQGYLVLDPLGAVVLEKSVDQRIKDRLELNQLPMGFYFLGVLIEGEYYWERILKQE